MGKKQAFFSATFAIAATATSVYAALHASGPIVFGWVMTGSFGLVVSVASLFVLVDVLRDGQ